MGWVRVGVDVGGTFTDVVVEREGELRIAKVPSTPADQANGVLAGLEALGVNAVDVERFVHGTTVATNAVLERRGARTAFVTTQAFRDVLEIGRQNRPKLYDLFADRPPPLVGRDMIVEAPERVAADGAVLRALAAGSAEQVAELVAATRADSVAVCLLFAFANASHERAIGDALAARGISFSLSSEVLPVFREYERASTTVLNAYVAPVMARYLGSLGARLRDAGLRCLLEIMRSGGGTFAADAAARAPVHTLLSGPAAGAWGAAAVGVAAGCPDVVAFDMGGTSTDATLIEDGRPPVSSEGSIGGLPFGVGSTEIHTVGAGGGSIAWADAGGSLRVGPRSAGADPGPAAYGRRGTQPTVTDAYVVLGLLSEGDRLGGNLRPDGGAARAAVGALAAGLGLGVEECAAGILRVVEAQVAKAVRVVSVARGHDPRRFALVPFGGAGALHQAALARELGFERVVVPRHPGVLSALGLLATPVAVDVVRTRLRDVADVAREDLDDAWTQLERRAAEDLARQGVVPANVARSADCRYRGQAFELEVRAPDGRADAEQLARAFHDAHDRRYGYAERGERVEIVNLRVRAEAATPELSLGSVGAGRGAETALRERRRVRLEDVETDCPVYDRDALGDGDRFDGPAIVAGADATCLLAAGQHAEVDAVGNLVVTER